MFQFGRRHLFGGCFPGVPKHNRSIWREFEFSQLCKMTAPLERAGSCARPCLLVGRCWRPLLTLDESFRERSGGGAGFGEQSQVLAGQRTASILGHVRRSLNGFPSLTLPFVRFHWLRVPGWSCVLDLCKRPLSHMGVLKGSGPGRGQCKFPHVTGWQSFDFRRTLHPLGELKWSSL